MEVTAPKAAQPYVLAANEGEAVWFVNNRAVIKASAADTGGAFGLVEMIAAPGHAPPLHIHHTEDEPIWVLEGRITVQCGDQTFEAAAGSFFYTPRGVPHTFRVEGASPARLLVMFVPGGGERFFIEAGRPAEGEGLPEPSMPDLSRMHAAAVRHDLEFVGAPLESATSTAPDPATRA